MSTVMASSTSGVSTGWELFWLMMGKVDVMWGEWPLMAGDGSRVLVEEGCDV
jgi:hypothetical protein